VSNRAAIFASFFFKVYARLLESENGEHEKKRKGKKEKERERRVSQRHPFSPLEKFKIKEGRVSSSLF
jgi:hypothetical protein